MNSMREFNEKDFPRNGSLKERILFLLRYAVLAPSTHNTQPWNFKVENRSCEIHLDESKCLPKADPLNRCAWISIGCCLENLSIAARYYGMLDKVDLNGSVSVSFDQLAEADEGLGYLLETIPKRRTARGAFRDEKVDDSSRKKLVDVSREYTENEPINVHFIYEKEKIGLLANLTQKGVRMAHSDPGFRREMSQWINHNYTSKKDGMPGYSLTMPTLISFVFPFLLRFFDMGRFIGKKSSDTVSSSPLVCIITSENRSPDDWVKVGRVVERMMLEAQSMGLQTSIFVAATEFGDTDEEIKKKMTNGEDPQFLFCIGKMDISAKLTPKVPVKEKMSA